jgi:RNA polymerase sigma-70 factor (ECF subfamily)
VGEDDGPKKILRFFCRYTDFLDEPILCDCEIARRTLFAVYAKFSDNASLNCRSVGKGRGGITVQVGGAAPDHSAIKEELDVRFRASLVAYFMRRTGSQQEAEDLTQETFARLIGSNTFEKADEAKAFVFRVASNLLRDRARAATRLRRFPSVPLDTVAGTDFEPRLVEGLDPERVLIAKENLAEVLASLEELGERTKNIFVLFRLEGMKQKAIAAIYGISVSTVEKHVMAAVLHLAKRFGSI